MKKLFIAIAGLLLVVNAGAQNADSILNHYIKLKEALVTAHASPATTYAGQLASAIRSTPAFAGQVHLQKAADKLAATTALDPLRNAFNELSTLLWDAVKGNQTVSRPLYYQYCPMKKSYWISFEKTIRNPYYGAAMLSCGKVVETKD